MNGMFTGLFDQQRSMQPDQLSGVWNAHVTNNKDPEKLGRVKVKFPLREGELETDWIRVASMMGGKDMGTLFIPEVNDEVLIAFMMGRMDQPVVIGSLWNDKDKPPAGGENNDIRKIKTRSGHEIEFNDKSGNESVVIKTNKGHTIEMSDKDKAISIQTQDKQYALSLDSSGHKVDLKCGSGASIAMTSQGDVTIKGSKSMSLHATQMEIKADASLKMQASGMLEISSSGMLTLKGSMVKIN
ncbi:phage baseplate assembly protein V [Paenibacillus sp. HB172176]|uniref:phage baseplate assembly protein V n=1 Tax=Paenibacillus sp. HB172176 TaxID=2493690 RepID=UPI00143B04CB|nr:phage baseplate assembly protein V [Paenibacillus sp. HB172176]